MSIWTPTKKTKVRSIPTPKRNGYRLPVQILDPTSMRDTDGEFLEVMMEHPPHTDLKEGDLVYLVECPPHIKMKLQRQERLIPLVWKVRFVVSAWAFELHNMAHSCPGRIAGIDHAVSLVEMESKLTPSKYSKPVVYAHAMPHGMWPDTALWFPEYVMRRNRRGEVERHTVLKKFPLRDPMVEWPTVLDEAKAPFVGFDAEGVLRPYVWEMAPDLYSDGENLGRPLSHEEATIHTACLLGMEPLLLGDLSGGVDPHYLGNPRILDPDHDIFKGKE